MLPDAAGNGVVFDDRDVPDTSSRLFALLWLERRGCCKNLAYLAVLTPI